MRGCGPLVTDVLGLRCARVRSAGRRFFYSHEERVVLCDVGGGCWIQHQ